MKIFTVVILLLMAALLGNKIGFEAARARYHGIEQDAWRSYGCRPWQEDRDTGECK